MPDTLVGTDSHTTMIDALGILGWGVGGIEAEAVHARRAARAADARSSSASSSAARLRTGVTATDLVLTLTEMLRRHGVVGKFVEFCGDGLSALSVPDRATLSQHGAGVRRHRRDLPGRRRDAALPATQTARGDVASLVEALLPGRRACSAPTATPTPDFTELLVLDLDAVEPSLAGPRRPQDRVALSAAPASFRDAFPREPNPVRAGRHAR